jgi:hypothetical protein
MACAQIEGSWPELTLVTERGDVMTDPVLVITPADTGGGFTGQFQDTDEEEFEVRCTEHGKLSRISFTRKHPGGEVTTVYRGIAVVVKDMIVSAGRFERTTTGLAPGVEVGDWETEKPT